MAGAGEKILLLSVAMLLVALLILLMKDEGETVPSVGLLLPIPSEEAAMLGDVSLCRCRGRRIWAQ